MAISGFLEWGDKNICELAWLCNPNQTGCAVRTGFLKAEAPPNHLKWGVNCIKQE